MNINLPMMEEEHFDEVKHQGKIISVGDSVIVPQAGQQRLVTVSSISKKQGHYWVGYDDNAHFCPWPLARLQKKTD